MLPPLFRMIHLRLMLPILLLSIGSLIQGWRLPRQRVFVGLISVAVPTNWGQWGEWDSCQPGTWFSSVELRGEGGRRPTDDRTSMNALNAVCTDTKDNYTSQRTVHSLIGNYGTWYLIGHCSDYYNGFRLRAEAYQGIFKDDTAVNDIEMHCRDGKWHSLSTNPVFKGHSLGTWTRKRFCKGYSAICGLRTQIDYHGGWFGLDMTAFNNVQFQCCNITESRATDIH